MEKASFYKAYIHPKIALIFYESKHAYLILEHVWGKKIS